MVLSKHALEGTSTPSIAPVTSLLQHTPVPAPPETKRSGESGRRQHSGEQKEGRREKKVRMRAVETVVQMREAGGSQGKLGAGSEK